MSSVGSTLGKKAAKAAARHTVRGFTSKARRRPLRSASLVSIGGVVGLSAGWLLGRKAA